MAVNLEWLKSLNLNRRFNTVLATGFVIIVMSLPSKYGDGLLIGLGMFFLGQSQSPPQVIDEKVLPARPDIITGLVMLVGIVLFFLGVHGVMSSKPDPVPPSYRQSIVFASSAPLPV